jgi:hypothetical protein
VPPPDAALAARRDEAGFAALERLADDGDFDAVERLDDDGRDDAGFAALERLEDEARFDAVERLDEDAGFAALERLDEDAGFAARERLDEDARFDAVERLDEDAAFEARREPVVDPRDEEARRAAGFFAAERVAAGAAAADDDAARGLPSSAETRLARPSTSPRRPLSSWRTRSSSTSRIRLAASATSLANSRAGPRSDWAPSAVAENVRSTADRTASTASTAPAVALSCFPSFFLESFFAIGARS